MYENDCMSSHNVNENVVAASAAIDFEGLSSSALYSSSIYYIAFFVKESRVFSVISQKPRSVRLIDYYDIALLIDMRNQTR